jgi:hypothetical protein
MTIHDFDIGASECTHFVAQVAGALRELDFEPAEDELGGIVNVIVSTWLSGYRFGTATVIAQASEQGIQLYLDEIGGQLADTPRPAGH